MYFRRELRTAHETVGLAVGKNTLPVQKGVAVQQGEVVQGQLGKVAVRPKNP